MAKGMSLHIGVNSVDPGHYAGWSGELNACEADAEDMCAIAASQGYATKVLLTSAAKRDAVTAEIRHAAEVLQPGDIFFLTYSGHGGQLPDLNGDEDDDLDETWCLHDGELIDDTLHTLFGRFREGVRILMTSDSCHSGTVGRDRLAAMQEAYASLVRYDPITGKPVSPRFRGMPVEAMRRTYLANRKMYDAELTAADPEAQEKVVARVRLISGCQDDQLSSDGPFNGLFTSRLKRVWGGGKFEGDYAAFHEAICKKMPQVQQPKHFVYGGPNPEFDAQRPFQI